MDKKIDLARPRIQCIPLVEGCQTFSDFYAKNWDLVRKFFFYDLRDYHEAEDVAQDVFLTVYVNLFQSQDRVDVLPKAQRENLTYHVKNTIWSVRSNRNTVLSRKINALVESALHTSPNMMETPLEAAVNASISLAGPMQDVRLRNFVEEVKSTMNSEMADALLYIFFGCSHDESQKRAGITHGTFYRSYADAKQQFKTIVEKHFDMSEYNGTD